MGISTVETAAAWASLSRVRRRCRTRSSGPPEPIRDRLAAARDAWYTVSEPAPCTVANAVPPPLEVSAGTASAGEAPNAIGAFAKHAGPDQTGEAATGAAASTAATEAKLPPATRRPHAGSRDPAAAVLPGEKRPSFPDAV